MIRDLLISKVGTEVTKDEDTEDDCIILKVVMPKNIDVGGLVTPKKEKDPDSTESPSMVQPLSILKIKSSKEGAQGKEV